MKYFVLILLIISNCFFSQTIEKCNLKKSKSDFYYVDANDIKCIAKNSEKKNTIFYVFGVWCAPCQYGLPKALGLEINRDVDVYVLLIDSENSAYLE